MKNRDINFSIFLFISMFFAISDVKAEASFSGESDKKEVEKKGVCLKTPLEKLLFKKVDYKSELYKKYLRFGELDHKVVAKHYFEGASPEEVNLALRDIRKFICSIITNLWITNKRAIDESFLINILNVYGYLIIYLEKARVDVETKKGFKHKRRFGNVERPNSRTLFSYWADMEQRHGVRLHWYKFYARAIDHLIILIRTYLMFSFKNRKEYNDMANIWMHWLLERLGVRLDKNSKFGAYYKENISFINEIFKIRENEFKKVTKKRFAKVERKSAFNEI
jgi:hypothetical protein